MCMSFVDTEYFQNSPELLCVFSFSGNLLGMNSSWQKAIGVASDDMFKKCKTLMEGPDSERSGLQTCIHHKDERSLTLQWSVTLLNTEKCFLITARDISPKGSLSLFSETEEVTHIGSWELDLASNCFHWSKMAHAVHETNPEEFVLDMSHVTSFFTHESKKLIIDAFEKLKGRGESFDLELPFVTAKGKNTWVSYVGRALIRNGVVERVYGTVEDVGLKIREKSIYEFIIETGNYGTWDWDLETNNVYFNERWCSLVGIDSKRVKHELATWDALAHPDDKMKAYKDINDHLSGKTSYYRNVHRMKHANGHWVWILDQGKVVEYRDGKPVRFAGTHTDVTYLKELEEERGVLNNRFKLILEAIKFGVWDWDLTNDNLEWDDNMCDLFGVPRDDFTARFKAWENTLHPDDKEKAVSDLLASINTDVDFDTSFRIILKNGEVRHIAAKGFVEKNESGKAVRVVGINWDITKKVEQDRIFETILNNIPIMITFYNRNGNIEWINPYWTEVLGWSFEEMKRVEELAVKLFATEEMQRAAVDFMMEAPPEWREFALLNKKGEITHTTWTNVKLDDGQIIGIGQDIGLKKRQEELIKDQQARMISSAKLSSLGEMASGIAHEINNPLAIIKGKAYQILKKLESNDVDVGFLIKEISKIEHNSLRIVKIIKGLRTFSRHGEGDPFQIVPFKNILDDVLELCHERFKYQGVELKTSGSLEVSVRCQETQFAQVLLNLVNNAHDAVVDTPAPWVHINVQEHEDCIRISVTDSGNGISEEVAQKIMQPFFTTKEVGMGTGLGLSISKGIVEMHGGKLFLERNCPNTCFVIEVPPVHV